MNGSNTKMYHLNVRQKIRGRVCNMPVPITNCKTLYMVLNGFQLAMAHSGHYITFSKDGKCDPADEWEVVMTIRQGDQILCPTSAGGDWDKWDNYCKLKANGVSD